MPNTSINHPNFRLPSTIRPIRYELTLRIYPEQLRYDGAIRIATRLASATDRIALHSKQLRIDRVLVNGSPPRGVKEYAEAEAIEIELPAALQPGEVSVEIDFAGAIETTALHGFYQAGDGCYATQFEVASARKVFPCFDEPEFKASVSTTLDIPATMAAIANAPVRAEAVDGARKIVSFDDTPPIPSYVIAFIIGAFVPTEIRTTREGVPVRAWLPQNSGGSGEYGRDAQVACLDYLTSYLERPCPYEKMDAIALPMFASGAMENVGAITYRAALLVIDKTQTAIRQRRWLFYTAAHEVTHMWWGNLVTMRWWDDLWLNESFATYVGFLVTDALNPTWGTWSDVVVNLERAFALDGLQSTHPVSSKIANAAEATERFDELSYLKGAAVLDMLRGYLGPEGFRAGVRRYLQRYAEGNASAEEFWSSLDERSTQEVGAIAKSWLTQEGYPLLDCSARFDANGVAVDITQRPFSANSAVKPAHKEWLVPLRLRCGTAGGLRTESVLLKSAHASVTLPQTDWYYPNADGGGFFRFNLDAASFARVVERLSRLTAAERVNLLDNQWTLLLGGQFSMADYLSLAAAYGGETDRAVLSTLETRLAWLHDHVLEEQAREMYRRFVETLFAAQHEALGWDRVEGEPENDSLSRSVVLSALGHMAERMDIQQEAARRIASHLGAIDAVDIDLLPPVIDLAAWSGDATLHGKYLQRAMTVQATNPYEALHFLMGLASFANQELTTRTAVLAIEKVPAHEAGRLIRRLLGGRHARRAIWPRLRDDWKKLDDRLDDVILLDVIRGLRDVTEPGAAAEVESFLTELDTAGVRAGPLHATIQQTVEQLRLATKFSVATAPQLTEALQRLS